MIKVNDKEWSKLEDAEKISYCNQLLEDVKQSREKRDLEWYLNHMFKEGQHYLTYNTVTSSIEANPPRKRGEVRMVVNKVRSTTRAIQNYVTASKPKWETVPGDIDEETITTARRLGKVLDYLYRKLHLEAMVSGVTESGLDTSVAWVEIDWDEDAERGEGQIRVRLHDSFDIWVDKRAYLYGGKLVSRFLAKTITKSLDEIKNDKRYDEKARDKVKEDSDPAFSRMKAKIIRREGGADEKSIKRTTVKEFMLWDDEPNDDGGHITLFTYAGNEVLRDEEMGEEEYPIYCFQISMNPLKIYQRAWTSDAIPLNKALDRTISQKIMYMNQALVYRIIAEKGHGAGIVSNEMGEIIEINKNRNFEQMSMHPLPAGFDSVSSELSSMIEDTLGAHDAALGRLPAGARSGKTLEALQAADANNLSGITASLESFLAVIGERILNLVAEKYVTSRVIKISDPEEGEEFTRIAGENAQARDDTTIVTKDNEVIVKIGSWLGHTKEGQRETLERLLELGAIDGKELLRQFEFPNVDEISERAREQRLEEASIQAEIAGRNQGGEQGAPEEEGIDMIALADKENAQMMQGEALPPTEGATPDHSQAHRDFIQSETFQSQASPEVQQIFIQHYQGEVGGGQQPAPPQQGGVI